MAGSPRLGGIVARPLQSWTHHPLVPRWSSGRSPATYRYFYHETDPKGIQSYSTFASPLAAYCWVPDLFPDFPPPEVGPRTLVDFVAAGASFVVEALLTLAMYSHEHRDPKLRSRRRTADAKGQIAAALGLPDGDHRIIFMPLERQADTLRVWEERAEGGLPSAS